MNIYGQQFNVSQLICLALYYGLARWFPKSGMLFNIGGRFRLTLCRHIAKGSVIAEGCVLTKDFSEYSVIGGNPSRVLKSRKDI